MKVEKKIVALSVLALIIGVATVLPLAYFTLGLGGSVKTHPSFDVDILYANVIPNPYGGNGDMATVITNFTLTSNSFNLNGADAKIEVFNFHMYSDKGSIANITHFVSLSSDVLDSNAPYGINSAITGGGDRYWIFADGTKYDSRDVIWPYSSAGIREDNFFCYADNPMLDEGYFVRSGSAHFSKDDTGGQSVQALANMKDAEVLYVDATRVQTVTYQHHANPADSTSPSIMKISANNEFLCTIELAKTDFGFASGSVPDFMINDEGYNVVFAYALPPGIPKPQQPQLPLSTGQLFNAPLGKMFNATVVK